MAQRPSSARPMTAAGRPVTSRGLRMTTGAAAQGSSRVTTATNQNVSARPASAAVSRKTLARRPPSAAVQRVGTAQWKRLGTATAIPGSSRLAGTGNAAQRPVTQQGLQGVRPSTGRAGLQNRQIQDESYYMGLLRTKLTELNAETNKLRIETEHYERERQNYDIYEAKAEELATEIKDLQGQLTDYNTLIDKLNSNSDVQEIQYEYERNKNQNKIESQIVDELFTERKRKEKELKDAESQLEAEKAKRNQMINEIDSTLQTRYQTLKEENHILAMDLHSKQEELIEINGKREDLEEELLLNQFKREAMLLYEKISELEKKKNELNSEIQSGGSVDEQRDKLLDKVKKDNEEIASMDRQSNEVRERVEQIREEMRELEEEIEDHQSEKNQKYRELRQKETQMDEFLESYEFEKSTELQKVKNHQKMIVKYLELISRAIETRVDKNSNYDYGDNLLANLSLAERCQKLQNEWNRLLDVEGKSKDELETTKRKTASLADEIETFSNFQKLEQDVNRDKETNLRDKANLSEELESLKNNARKLSNAVDRLKAETNQNEMYLQFMNLDKKLQQIEHSNASLREYVDNSQKEAKVSALRDKVMSMVVEYNQLLVQSVSSKTTRLNSGR